jgi:hypothetical protein
MERATCHKESPVKSHALRCRQFESQIRIRIARAVRNAAIALTS